MFCRHIAQADPGFLDGGSNLQRGFDLLILPDNLLIFPDFLKTWVKVLRNIPEFRILRLTFRRKSASKC